METEEDDLSFYRCDPRSVFPVDRFHVPKRMKRYLKKSGFIFELNKDFEQVVDGCREGREYEEWIGDRLKQLYLDMHEAGYANSAEIYHEGKLAGGVLFTLIGRAVFAESMFHRVTHASNAALIKLVELCRENQIPFVDIQYSNSHTERFKPVDLENEEFMNLLESVLDQGNPEAEEIFRYGKNLKPPSPGFC